MGELNPYNAPQRLHSTPSYIPGAPPPPAAPPSYVNPVYQPGVPNAAPAPAQAGRLPFGRALAQLPRQYLSAITKPAAIRYTQEMGDARWGLVWIQLCGYSCICGIIFALLGLRELLAQGTALSTPALAFAVFAIGLLVSLIFVAGFFLDAGWCYLLARRAGGRGTFLAQCYCTLLFFVPGVIVVSLLVTLFPTLSWVFSLAWLIYTVIQTILVIKAVHGLSGGRSSAVVLLPLVFMIAAFVSLASQFRVAQGDPAELAGEIIGAFGFPFLLSWLILAPRRRVEAPAQVGRRIMATVTRIDWQPVAPSPDPHGAQGTWVVTAVGTDPQTQGTYTFWQRFNYAPRCTQGGPVTIVLDAPGPGRYYMEL